MNDAAVTLPRAAKQLILLNSPKYFAFTAKHPKLLPWLALGENVQFVFENTANEIYE